MKNRYGAILMLLALAGIAVFGATAFRRRAPKAPLPGAERRFEVRGQIRGLEDDGRSLRVAHEEIPGYMPAMTMVLPVNDPSVVTGLQVGDEIGFQLVVTETDSWIGRVQRLSERAGSAIVNNAIRIGSDSEGERVQPGETVPNFKLLDQKGSPFELRNLRGKAVLLTFIYTRCPLPNFCPLMSRNFAALQERLQKAFPGKFELLSVSIDPAFDRPEILKEYAARWSRSDQNWIFATGSEEEIRNVGALFGLIRQPAGGLINHDLRTILIGPDGKLVHIWRSNMWTPYEVHRRVEEVLHSRKST